MELPYDPFIEDYIANYDQYKVHPVLECPTLKLMKNRMVQQATQISRGFFFSERSLLIGVKGIGKTTALFFLRDTLTKNGVTVIDTPRLIESESHFEMLIGKSVEELITESGKRKPFFLLVDFPDSISPQQFKNFLTWVDKINRNPKMYNYVNMVFAMNKSMFNKADTYSLVLGKFVTLNLERFNYGEVQGLLDSRLKAFNINSKEIFSAETIALIHSYSQGIPRNVVSAAGLLINSRAQMPITKDSAQKILSKDYVEKILINRIEDRDLKVRYTKIIEVLKHDLKGSVESQDKLINILTEKGIVSRATAIKDINKLIEIGVLQCIRGGYNRFQKVISLL